jgi:tripartite-type tricarboxylate transporter receptor subunit TctC
MNPRRRTFLAGLALLAGLASSGARAQTPEAFYKTHELRLLISHPPGGGYDAYARLLARHLAAHVPGKPSVVPQNMPGAAGVVMANYMATAAPRDGSVIALGPGSIGTSALFGASGARYDARRFLWIGSLNSEVAVAVSWQSSPVRSATDLLKQELLVGGAGSTDQSVVFPNALNKVLGTHFKVIPGYPGSSDNALALERGEVAGIGGWNYSSIMATRPDWIAQGKVHVLLQLSLARHPQLPDVPTVLELAHSDDQRAVLKLIFAQSTMGRAVFAPPEVPADRANVLRQAFADVLADPDFLEDARRSNIEINQPMSGEAVQGLVDSLHASSPDLIRQAAAAIESPKIAPKP